MTISSISGAGAQAGQMGRNQAADSYSRNIQNQIANVQKQMQELSSNDELSLEEKMKKWQELQQQISDLNMQLRQHQVEQRREKQQEKSSSADDILGGTGNEGKTGSKGTGLSQASMAAMLSAGTSMKQAKVQGSVATKMEGRAGVLKSEIQQDGARGVSTEKKKEELTDVERKAQKATASQISALTDAVKTMEEAAEEDGRADDKAKKAGSETTQADGRTEKADGEMKQADDRAEKTASETGKTDAGNAKTVGAGDRAGRVAAEATAQQAVYRSVDIRL